MSVVLVCYTSMVFSQLSDKIWLGGYSEFPGQPDFEHFQVYFGTDGPLVEGQPLAFNFESTVAVAADKYGAMLFYSNGCEVANRNHVPMPNGQNLSEGDIAELVCPWKGYIVPQGAMVLPWPGNSNQFCLLHMDASYEPQRKLKLDQLNYSVINMTLDGGLGDVIQKRMPLLTGDLGNFTAIRHGNGRDWWILTPEHNYHQWRLYLFTPAGLQEEPSQTLSNILPDCEHFGQISVNPDGDRIAVWGDCKIVIWQFNRCSGTLGPPVEYPTPAHWFNGGGVAFSKSGRYLYATDQVSLQRIDLESTQAQLDTMRFSYNSSSTDIRKVPGNSFHHLTLGPDGYIYGTVASRGRYFHVLKENDGLGIADLEFIPKGLQLPGINVRTIPHFPNFRLADMAGSLCDTLGINEEINATQVVDMEALKLYPNPVGEQIQLQWQDGNGSLGFYQIFNATGMQVLSGNLLGRQTEIVDIRVLLPGLYAIQINLKSGKYYARFIKG